MNKTRTTAKKSLREGPAVKNAGKPSTHPLLDAAKIQDPHKPPVSQGWNKDAAAALATECGNEITLQLLKMSASEQKAVQSVFTLLSEYKDVAGWKNVVKAAYLSVHPGSKAAANGK